MAGRCNASQNAQNAWDAGDASLASGRNADGSDAGSVFADAGSSAYHFCSRRKTKNEAFFVHIPDIPWQEVVFLERSQKLVVIIAKGNRIVGKDSLLIDLCTKLSSYPS